MQIKFKDVPLYDIFKYNANIYLKISHNLAFSPVQDGKQVPFPEETTVSYKESEELFAQVFVEKALTHLESVQKVGQALKSLHPDVRKDLEKSLKKLVFNMLSGRSQ